MNYHEAISRAIDIQAHIRALEEDFPEIVDIEPNYIQIKWEAFSVLFPDDSNMIEHYYSDCHEYKCGWYNGSYIITCREVRPYEA